MLNNQEDIYQERILTHYEEPFHCGNCPHATHCHADDNPLCGDFVRLELNIGEQGIIQDAWFSGDGCCVSQAAASMLTERICGKSLDELKDFSAANMLDLFGVKLTPNRQKCCLLSWRVFQSAIYSPIVHPHESSPS
jgi:nitrogen fixation NifU-like protein